MKKVFVSLIFLAVFASFVSASCDISVGLLNQDPYPAVPGEYVKVVFQINGTESSDCNKADFDIVPEYPFSIESNETKSVILGGSYLSGYNTYLLKAYKLVVDKNALDGDQKLRVAYRYYGNEGATASYTKDFLINVQDTLTDFDVSIQDYDAAKNTITFGIANIGKKDVESLTLEILNQDSIQLKGADKVIVGSLSSNDDTTVSVEAIPSEGDITVKLSYNDEANVRRTIEKVVRFDNRYLLNGTSTTGKGAYYYLFWLLILIIVGRYAYRYYQNKKAKNNNLRR